MVREFTVYDWHGYAGAERFSDGSAPLIGECNAVVVIADRYQIEISVLGKIFSLQGINGMKYYKKGIVERILKIAERRTPKEIENALLGMGFERT